MAIKDENEVTVKVICSKDELTNYLNNHEFKSGREFSLDDYYYVPSSLNIENMVKSNYFKIYCRRWKSFPKDYL